MFHKTFSLGMGSKSHPLFIGDNMNIYKGIFADIPVSIGFHQEKAAEFYGNWLNQSDQNRYDVQVPKEHIELWQKQCNRNDPAYSEYILSCSYICDSLMSCNRMVFHGAVFKWHEKAYIFTAPSGTGKTTQLRLWVTLFPDEMTILNGDKPILEMKNNEVIVHPSPWKGKENLGRDDIIAPLGGIIFLRQDKANLIQELTKSEAAGLLFGRSYTTFSTEKEVLMNAELLSKILESVPVWLLKNNGDSESAIITHKTLMGEV